MVLEQDQYEVYEIFKEEFLKNIPQIKQAIDNLLDTKIYNENINALFRIFHGMKANSQYFHFDAMMLVAQKVEKLLASLRDTQKLPDRAIYEWLLVIAKKCEEWAEEIEDGCEAFSVLDTSVLETIHLINSDTKVETLIKKFRVLYFDTNKERSIRLVSLLQTMCGQLFYVKDIESFKEMLATEVVDIVIVNGRENIEKSCEYAQKQKSAFIAVVDKFDLKTYLFLTTKEIYYSLKNPVTINSMRRELQVIADLYFMHRRCIVTSSKIKQFIQELQPLSDSLMQIQQICNDDELSIKDLIDVVKLDPIVSAMILKTLRDPNYGLHNIYTVQQAVSIFGKSKVQAIAFSSVVDEFGKIDLGAYGISEDTFLRVSTLRFMLMVKWYSKVSIAALSTLSTTAILGNIGQILIAKELRVLKKEKEFSLACMRYPIREVEEQLLHTTSAYVTSDILSYWKLDKNIVDSIRYSDYLNTDPFDEIYPLALANYIVYTLIQNDGTILNEIPSYIYKLMEKRGLEKQSLLDALEFVKSL